MSDDLRIDILTDAIKKLPKGGMKDAVADDLRAAQAINGSTDPMQQAFKRLLISSVRKELSSHERITEIVKEAIATQVAICHDTRIPVTGSAKTGLIFAWLEAVKPFRWPIAIVCFSPFAGDIIARVVTIFK